MLALLLFSSVSSIAQSGIILSWDSEVGCLDYGYDKDREQPIETLGDEDCLQVCQESTVSFTVDYGTQPVTDISWTSDGGQVISLSNGDATAAINWPDDYPNGNVTVQITLADGQVINGSICVSVKAQPEGGFEILGQVSQYFCSEAELIFDNQAFVPDGTQIVASVWDFGDGTTSSEFNPTHTYYQDGLYEITLTVYDECGCSNSWKTDIIITKPGIIIECPTPVCEGALETYTLQGPAYANGDVNCQTYQWTVEGGTLIDQGQDWIQVLWDHPGADGFGYVYFDQQSCDVYCDNQMVIKVPVIPAHGNISGGATELCQGDQSRYALPQWPTTDVEWTVTPANNPGYVIPEATILVDQRNEIAVDGSQLQVGDYILHADYTNTLLKCGGEADFHFTVLQKPVIDENQTTAEICEGNTADFFLTQTIPGVTWTISQSGQTVATVPGSGSNSQGSYTFNTPGHYSVSATANGYCTVYTGIDIIDVPSVANASILGSLEICPLQAETYTFDVETNGFDVEWTVDHGDFLGPNVGESVTIKFDPGFTDYVVSAQLVHPNYETCASDWVTLPVELFQPDAQIVQTTGDPNAICTSSEESFELQGYPGMDIYEWTVVPAELAHVSSGAGTENVNILFNEPYQGQTQGTITVKAKVCGVMTVLDQVNFELDQNPVLTVTGAPTGQCPAEPFTIQVSSTPPIPASSLSIGFDAALDGTNPGATLISPGVYEFQNIALANVNPNQTVNVGYTITADGPDLCGETQVSGTLDRFPAPIIQASYTGGTVFCTTQEINTVLHANLQGSGVNQSDITWMYGGNSIGTGATLNLGNISTSGFGNYTAVATNADGCQTVSNIITLIQDCSPGDPPCSFGATVSGQWTACELITLTATYPGNPVSTSFVPSADFTSQHSSPLQPTTNGNTYTQQFETDASGTYLFVFEAEYANCVLSEAVDVSVEYKAALLQSIECDAGGDFEVTMLNQSTYTSGSNPTVDYTYTQNPGGQTINPDTENDDQATATLGNGDYTLTLTLSSPGKPTCEVSENIHLQKPVADFSLNNTEVCSTTEVDLHPDVSTPDATYLWDFQDATNTLENIHPTLGGTGAGNAEITLTVTDPYGCSDSDFETIVVHEPAFTGDISPSGADICPNQWVDLEYNNPPFGDSPAQYQWLNNTVPINNATTADLDGVAQPGEYSIYLTDDFGCLDKTISSVYINQIQPPHLSAQITASVCEGEAITLTGSLNPDGTEYRIERSKNGNPYILVQDWTVGPAVNYTDAAPSVGSYTYKVMYKDPQTECATEKFFDAVVHPTPDVAIQMDNLTCSPYTIELTAIGNQSGTYLWSNGMSGATIIVDHGGPYAVNFSPDGANCIATDTYTAPKSPDVYSWIFPTGCFSYCKVGHENFPYLIGPIPYFSGYAYEIGGNPIDVGLGVVPDLVFANDLHGSLTLSLSNGYCDITTDPLDVTLQNCQSCDLPFKIDKTIKIEDPAGFVYYQIVGSYIHNPYPFPITVHLSSEYGVFIPAALTIGAGSTYSFANDPVDFIPDNPSQGTIPISYTVSGNYGNGNEILCQEIYYVDFEEVAGFQGGNSGIIQMTALPNPVETATEVQYKIENQMDFNGGIIKLYSLSGKLIKSQNVTENRGQIRFDLSGLSAGTYVVVFFGRDQRLGQQVIIKE